MLRPSSVRLMRPFVGAVVALVVLWCVYLGSPYWALWSFLSAVESRDPARIAERVNVRAVRLSLAKQIAQDGMASKALAGATGAAPSSMTASAIAAAADPIIEQIVTPEGLVALAPEIRETSRGASGWRIGGGRLASFLQASRWRGFRNVYFTLPPGAAPDRRVRLQFRLSRLSWRLVGIEPTPETRARLLADLVRLRRPGG
jgi:hypothetical protein